MNSKLIIIGVVVFIVIILIIIILKFTSPNKNPKPPTPECPICNQYETCDIETGRCVPKTSCGPKIVPSGSQCTIENLECNLNTYEWQCKPNTCLPGYEGKLCNCNMEKKKNYITDVCLAKIPICQDSGEYSEESANTCNQINSYLNFLDTNITDYCSKSCTNNGEAICLENPARIICQSFCRTTGPSESECNNCLDTESCICDETTGNQWTCKTSPPAQSACPPKPIPSNCYNSAKQPLDLICKNCRNGYIEYCQGSQSFPLDCMTLGKEIAQGIDIFTSNNLPIYPTIDNDKCKQMGTLSTDFLEQYDRSWKLVDNPSAFTYMQDGNLKIEYFNKDNPNFMYYPSGQPNVNCWWDDHPLCTLNGERTGNPIQQCGYANEQRDCNLGEDNDRLKRIRCECYSYTSNVNQQYKSYLGDRCQYSDNNTCNSNGIVDDNGNCFCITDYAGKNCEFSRQQNCNNHGTPDNNGTCSSCDENYGGPNCQYSREITCQNRGIPKYDGTCTCDNNTIAGSNCQYSNAENCNNHGQVNNDGSCRCYNGYYESNCVDYKNVQLGQIFPFLGFVPFISNNGRQQVTWGSKTCYNGPCQPLNLTFEETYGNMFYVYDNNLGYYWSNCFDSSINNCQDVENQLPYNLNNLRSDNHKNKGDVPIYVKLERVNDNLYILRLVEYIVGINIKYPTNIILGILPKRDKDLYFVREGMQDSEILYFSLYRT